MSTENTNPEVQEELEAVDQLETTEEPKKEEEPEFTPKDYDDLHKYENPYRAVTDKEAEKLKEVRENLGTDGRGQKNDIVAHPPVDDKRINEFLTETFNWSESQLSLAYPGDNIQDYARIVKTGYYEIPRGMLSKYIYPKDNRYVNKVNYGGKDIDIKTLSPKIKGNETITNGLGVAKITSMLKLGETMYVPLWNSGFWISIVPPQQRDLINLEIQIAKEEVNLGRTTWNYIYSNYAVIYTRIITDFIISNIKESTLQKPAEDDYRKYIKMTDLYPLVLGILCCIYPKGLPVTVFCANNTVIGEDGLPTCDYKADVNTDPKKLLVVNRDKLTDKMLEQMSRRLPNSVTVNEALDYQERIRTNATSSVKLTSENDVDIEFEFKIPTIAENIDLGEKWVSTIESKIEDLFTSADGKDAKDAALNKIADIGILSIYSSFVNSIKTSNEEETIELTQVDLITDTLDKLSIDDNIAKGFIKAVDRYIYDSSISIVAIPNFICPKCKEEGNKVTKKVGGFKEFIPIEVLKYFLDHVNLRINTVIRRTLS